MRIYEEIKFALESLQVLIDFPHEIGGFSLGRRSRNIDFSVYCRWLAREKRTFHHVCLHVDFGVGHLLPGRVTFTSGLSFVEGAWRTARENF